MSILLISYESFIVFEVIKISNGEELNESREIRKVSFNEFMKLSENETAEGKCYSFARGGDYVKVRLFLEETWYVAYRYLSKTSYRRKAPKGSSDAECYTDAEVFLDCDAHPYWLAYYGKGDSREEFKEKFKEYHELFIRNTDFGSGKARLNQQLLSKVKRTLEGSEKHSEIFERWKRAVEKKEKEAKKELREAFFEDISLPSNPSGYFDREEFFRNWYRDHFLGEDYQEKIEKTSKAKSRAFKRWVENFRKKLERKGFKPVDEENQSR